MTTRSILALVGFEGDGLEIGLGVTCAEAGGKDPVTGELFVWADAIGDWRIITPTEPTYDPVAAAKWGPSIGPFQNRALLYPHVWGALDHVREVYALLDPIYNAHAAFVISKGGTDWSPWSTFRNGTYLPFVGQDRPLRIGHPQRDKWKLGVVRPPTA